MYKVFCLALLSVLAVLPLQSQSAQTASAGLPVLEMPPVDNDQLRADELAARVPGRAPHFAFSHEVDLRPATAGQWDRLPDGRQRWQLRLRSAGALSLNLGFTEYYMPPGGELYLHAGKEQLGPFTPADNEVHQQLWTPVLAGDELIVEVRLPAERRKELRLWLTHVNHDFMGFAALMSGSCNLDVMCGAADGWGIVDNYRDIIQSVAVYSLGGSTFCTGFLINNSLQDCKPYFMTANHCGVGASEAPSLVVSWNFVNSFCRQPNSTQSGSPGNGSLADFNTGAIFRAGFAQTDFTLLELDDEVSPTANAYFAGWSRSMTPPSDTVIAIHHPDTDEKRISFSFRTTYRVNGVTDVANPNGTHIAVPDWDIGTTEGGSSGSPLFDRFGRVRGQLHGGAAACGNNEYDSYGFFGRSWTGGGTPSTRLSDWLDPADSGISVLDGRWQGLCNFSVVADPPQQTGCLNATTSYSLSVGEGFSGPVTLSLQGLPSGVSGTISQNPVPAGGTTSLILTTSSGAGIGTFTFMVSGTDGTNSAQQTISLVLQSPQPAAPALQQPANGASGLVPNLSLVWQLLTGATSYELQLATNPGFSNLLEEVAVDGQTSVYTPAGLQGNTTYYWRLRTVNACGVGPWSAPFSFATSDVSCSARSAEDVPVSITPDAVVTVTSKLTISESLPIDFISVDDIDILHSYVGDLRVTLTSPEGTTITLFDRPGYPASNFGCNQANLLLSFSDGAEAGANVLENTCNGNGAPAIEGQFKPVDALAGFNGENAQGTWTLTIYDNANGDGGALRGWSLSICGSNTLAPDLILGTDELRGCLGDDLSLTVAANTGFSAGDIQLTVTGLPQGATVAADPATVTAGGQTTLTLTNVPAGNWEVEVVASHTSTAENAARTLMLIVEEPAGAALLLQPAADTVTYDDLVDFAWEAVDNTEAYVLRVARDEDFTDIAVETELAATASQQTLAAQNDWYYWQVITRNSCGETASTTGRFKVMTTSVTDPAGFSLQLFPNPSRGMLTLRVTGSEAETLALRLFTVNGRQLQQWTLPATGGDHALELQHLPAGTYWLDIRSAAGRRMEKVVLLP